MTQMDNPYQGDMDAGMGGGQPAKKSGVAITALVMSLLALIPCLGMLTAPLGVLLGLIGVVTISPPRTGKGMAVAAVLIGLVLGGAQFYGGKKAYDFFYSFYALVVDGPGPALEKAKSGDYAGFRAEFHNVNATDDDVRALMDELTDRYGAFLSARLDEQAMGNRQPQPGQAEMVAPYIIEFADATVDAEAELLFADQGTGEIIKKLGYMRIIDPDLGDLVFPEDAPTGSGTGNTATGGGAGGDGAGAGGAGGAGDDTSGEDGADG